MKRFSFFVKGGRVMFNVIKIKHFAKKLLIFQALHRDKGDDVQVEIEFVDETPRTSSGKNSLLIQQLPLNEQQHLEG